jgi:diguanylate cyclase (GGDEF)-like protein
MDRNAQEQLGPSGNPDRTVESGIIVPLIVGARVVGTLACWSRRPSAFNADDERVLEMMASQVATAIVAADTMDTSHRRAHQDPLTELPNRLQLHEDITGYLSLIADSGRSAAVAMADIDHFKELNDDFGHRVGDVTLQKIASVLRNATRPGDRVYRYGGEEFLFIFEDVEEAEAIAVADRVREAVAATPLTADNLEPIGPVTISIGLAILPDHGIDIEELIRFADSAMYSAKQTGRNRVVIWKEPVVVATSAAA